ncbi:MAG TPA: alpha/beta hydrolase [Desulfobacteraceae bacterium]|nr:MAG: alpha/beta hydrolase [Deltaproteobacteria bacterium]HDI61193.1 alpha/beta hydrolase [Desulfobacteraceae bacterium]
MSIYKLVAGGVVLYLAWCLLLFFAQRFMLFPAAMADGKDEARPPAGFVVLHFETPAGTVEGWYLPPPQGTPERPGPVMIFAHGNAETIDTAALDMAAAATLGLGLLAIEYPGYGRSAGRPSHSSITAAMRAAYDALAARPEVDARRVVACGRSLGGAAACALAQERPLAALILVSTFTRVADFTRRYLVPSFLVRDPFDNLAAVSRFKGPLLIVHGRSDAMIPFDHALRLHRAAPGSRLVAYACDHNDCPPDWGVFWQDLGEFLQAAGVTDNALKSQR